MKIFVSQDAWEMLHKNYSDRELLEILLGNYEIDSLPHNPFSSFKVKAERKADKQRLTVEVNYRLITIEDTPTHCFEIKEVPFRKKLT